MNPIDKVSFKKPDIFVGFVIVTLVIIGGYLYKRSNNPQVKSSPTPVSVEYKKDFEDSFRFDIPDDTNTIELSDVNGGNSRGLATDNEILVDAEKPADNYFYEAWLESDSSLISLGKLTENKGGWIVEYNKSELDGAKKIIVSLERNLDQSIEKIILEGSFK